MLVWPVSRKMAMARLRRLAMTWGALPVRTWERSSCPLLPAHIGVLQTS
jgi:hypothetical protein